MEDVKSKIEKALFCPTCHTNSVHRWYEVATFTDPLDNRKVYTPVRMIDDKNIIMLSKCDNCRQISYWHNDKKIYPQIGDNPPPNQYLSEDIQKIYNEANSIANLSDRGTRGLLRLALDKLLTDLGIKGDKLHQKIQALKDSSNQTYHQAEIIRLLGNDAVHVEKLISEDIPTEFMFEFINLITERLIELPQKTTELHNKVDLKKNKK